MLLKIEAVVASIIVLLCVWKPANKNNPLIIMLNIVTNIAGDTVINIS